MHSRSLALHVHAYLLTYLVLLHFKARRANRGDQISPGGSVKGKVLGLCQGHIAGPEILGHDIQPARAGGTSGSLPACLLGVKGQGSGQADGVAVPAHSPHCCEARC